MSVEIAAGDRVAVLLDDTDDTAFGPVFRGAEAREQAEHFLSWFTDGGARAAAAEHTVLRIARYLGPGDDPRHFNAGDLEWLHAIWASCYLTDDGKLTEQAWMDLARGGRL